MKNSILKLGEILDNKTQNRVRGGNNDSPFMGTVLKPKNPLEDKN